MTNLTKEDQGIGKWNAKCDEAFERLKEAITNAPLLFSPHWSKPLRCHIDASQTTVGGTVTQLDEMEETARSLPFSRALLYSIRKSYPQQSPCTQLMTESFLGSSVVEGTSSQQPV